MFVLYMSQKVEFIIICKVNDPKVSSLSLQECCLLLCIKSKVIPTIGSTLGGWLRYPPEPLSSDPSVQAPAYPLFSLYATTQA